MRSDTIPAPFNDITATYTSACAWMYERVVAPAVYASHLAFADHTFDGVISYGSIKHWTSRDAGLAECVRVFKPGARC
jgi:SAM-dependent methyltransferase